MAGDGGAEVLFNALTVVGMGEPDPVVKVP